MSVVARLKKRLFVLFTWMVKIEVNNKRKIASKPTLSIAKGEHISNF